MSAAEVSGAPHRFVLVGCGRISRNHLRALDDHAARARLVAVCDADGPRAEEIGAARGVPAFRSLEAMLAAVDADAALIGTPSGLHAEHSVRAAEAGLHVVTEKPMAITLASADEMIHACDRAGRRLFVIKQNRLNPTIQLLRRAILKGRFGRIYLAQVNVFWTRPQAYYDQARWRGTWEFDGGAFMNQASHYVDMIGWLIGEVSSVQAVTTTLGRRIEAEDTGAAILHFRSGAVGTINVTMLTYPRNLEGSITVLGERGSVKIGGTALNRVETWDFAEYDDDDKEVEGADYSLPAGPGAVYGHGHSLFLDRVLSVLDGHEEALTDGRDGRKSVELTRAIYTAARERRIVSLPLEA